MWSMFVCRWPSSARRPQMNPTMVAAAAPEELALEEKNRRELVTTLVSEYDVAPKNIHLNWAGPGQMLPLAAQRINADVMTMGAIARSGSSGFSSAVRRRMCSQEAAVRRADREAAAVCGAPSRSERARREGKFATPRAGIERARCRVARRRMRSAARIHLKLSICARNDAT